MKVGSMFAGIGGFDLGFKRAGVEVAWCIEWDKAAQAVLRKRFPEATIYGDIREVDPEQLEKVDVICGGFPCQDLSVAGKRKGLAGERSGLFHDAMRLVRRINPSLLVLENVPGLLSSNRGLDFATVLREVGEGWDCAEVAWRVLDSRYFGVAQRRRRVFVVASAREGCAEQVLALAEGVQWHPAPRDEAREDSPGDAARSPERGGGKWPAEVAPTLNCAYADKMGLEDQHALGGAGHFVPSWWDGGDTAASMTTRCHAQSMPDKSNFAAVIDTVMIDRSAFNQGQNAKWDCPIEESKTSFGLIARGPHAVAVPIHDKATRHEGQSGKGSGNGLGIGADGDPAPTLTIGDKHAVAVNISNGEPRVSDVAGTLDAARESRGSSQQRFVMQSAFRKSKRAQTADDDETWVDDGIANTLNGFDTGDTRTTHAVAFGIDAEMNGSEEVIGCMKRGGEGGSQYAVAFTQNQREEVRNLGDCAGALSGQGTHQTNYVAHTIDMQACKGNANVGDGRVSPTLCKPSGNDVHAVAIDVYNQTIDGDCAATLTSACGGTNTSGPKVAISFKTGNSAKARSDGMAIEQSPTLGSGAGGNTVPAVVFPIDGRNAMRDPEKHDEVNRQGVGVGNAGEPSHTVTSAAVHAVAFTCKDYGADASKVAPTLRAMPHDGSHANGGGQVAVAVLGDHTHTLTHEGHDASEDGTGRGTPVVAFSSNMSVPDVRNDGCSPCLKLGGTSGNNPPAVAMEVAPPLTATNDPSRSPQSAEVTNQIASVVRASRGMVVRRLTPVECERLQGFPDGWTQIGTAEKPTADSHRYKQLGNAVTVNVAEWIARRAMKALKGEA